MALRSVRLAVKDRLPFATIIHCVIYGAGKIATSAISMITTPLLIFFLTPSDYGLLSLIHSFNNSTIALVGLGLPQVLMIDYFHTHKDGRGHAINSILGTYLLVNIPIFGYLFAHPELIANHIFFSPDRLILVYAVLFICFFSFINDCMYQLLQYHGRAWLVTAIQLSVALLTAVLTVVALTLCNGTVTHCVLIQCILVLSLCGGTLFLYYKNRLYTSFSINGITRKFRDNIGLGVPMLPAMSIVWLLALLNRWMMVHYAGLETTGIFAIADAGGQLFYRFLWHPLHAAYTPSLMNAYSDPNKNMVTVEQSNQQVMWLILLAILGILIGGYYLGRLFLYPIIPTQYTKAIDLALGICIAYTFLMGAHFVSNLLQFNKKRLIFFIAFITSTTINIILNIWLIPLHGPYGSTYALITAYATYFLLLFAYNRTLLHHLQNS